MNGGEHFISTPNLPNGTVSSMIVGSGYSRLVLELKKRGIAVLELPYNPLLPLPVRGHADLSAYYCGNGRLIVSPAIFGRLEGEPLLAGAELTVAELMPGKAYPEDIALNACRIGQSVFCRSDMTDPVILSDSRQRGLELIHISQGYAKCSICIVDEAHMITSDRGIAADAAAHGIDALLISPGFFRLPGYDYGFIGGSSFKLGPKKLAFTGYLSGHPDEKRIMKYLEKLNIEPVFLCEEPCFDIGSAIPLHERS